MDNIKKLFGKRLRHIREANNLTREGLAAMCNCSPVNIAKLESGDRFISADSLAALATALKVKAHEFFIFEAATGKKPKAKDQLEILLNSQDEKTLRLIRDVTARILRDL